MNLRRASVNSLNIFDRLVRYNLKIIFANKFLYFLLTAVAIFLGVSVINLINAATAPSEASAFWLLLVPGILLIFYPATFGIQNDIDARMIEILFGIPNYRYKVWLVRFGLIAAVTFLIQLGMTVLYAVVLGDIAILTMTTHVMFPVLFIGALAFMLSTIVRSGNGTALVMVVIGIGLWLMKDQIGSTEWYVFFNPFALPDDVNEIVWSGMVLRNRLYLIAGTFIAVLWGLLNLQKRERFV